MRNPHATFDCSVLHIYGECSSFHLMLHQQRRKNTVEGKHHLHKLNGYQKPLEDTKDLLRQPTLSEYRKWFYPRKCVVRSRFHHRFHFTLSDIWFLIHALSAEHNKSWYSLKFGDDLFYLLLSIRPRNVLGVADLTNTAESTNGNINRIFNVLIV